MQLTYLPASSSQRRARIVFETDQERALTKDELLLIVDNGRGVRWNHDRSCYELTGDFGAARHFGGLVDRISDDCVKVTVYID